VRIRRIISGPRNVEVIASGQGVKIRRMLSRIHGSGRWRKMKGIATVELDNGSIFDAEVHWFEAHGIGRVQLKIKRPL